MHTALFQKIMKTFIQQQTGVCFLTIVCHLFQYLPVNQLSGGIIRIAQAYHIHIHRNFIHKTLLKTECLIFL